MTTFEAKAIKLIERLLAEFPTIFLYGACAVAGNGGEESGGLNPVQETHPIGGGAGGYSWFQWTGPRRTAFFNWCLNQKIDPNSDDAAIGFLIEELKTTQKLALAAMLAVPDLEAKVKAFMNTFERPNPAYAHLDVRHRYARRALAAWNAYQSSKAPTPATPVPVTQPPVVAGPDEGSPMFNIASLIGLISQAPTIIEGVMKLVSEIEAGYAQGKKAGGDPIVIFEDILAQLVANKGAVAKAVLGPEPAVAANGTILPSK